MTNMMRHTIVLATVIASFAVFAADPTQNQQRKALVQSDYVSRSAQLVVHTGRDSRVAVALPEDDHARIVEDMRLFLAHTADLLDATADRDWEKVKSLAATAQPPLHLIQRIAKGAIPDLAPHGGSDIPQADSGERNRTRPARMQRNLPQAYRDMLLQRRLIIGEIARDAEAIKDPLHTIRQVSQIQRICVACHLTYRHEVTPVVFEDASPAVARPD